MSTASIAPIPVLEESLNFPGVFSCQYGPCSSGSILIFLTVDGSVIPMHVMESDSIASVKLKIQSYKGFFVKRQKLVYEGRELARNDCCVRDYGVADGNIVHLVLRLSDLQAITIRTVCGKEFEFHIEKSRNVGYVKQQIAKKGRSFPDLKDQELIFDGKALEDQTLIYDISKSNDAVIHLLVRKSAKFRANPVEQDFELSIEALNLNEKGADALEENQLQTFSVQPQMVVRKPLQHDFLLEPLIVNCKVKLPSVILKLIDSTLEGLESGKEPVASSEGSGGTYFVQDISGKKYVSVLKPIDEEPMAVNNPRGLTLSADGEGLKKGTQVGEGALREVAAYILDHPRGGPHIFHNVRGFSGVPPTAMVKCLHKGLNYPEGFEYTPKNVKICSLQMFMENSGSCEDMGPRDFLVDEVHKITVLDIRLANADRHAGNILVNKDGRDGHIVLIPIDHGYCIPKNFKDCTFDWLYWPQARQLYSPDTVDYIKSLDAEQDIALLKFHGWNLSPVCARTLHISTMLLKKGVERGLSPYIIGSIMCRETLKKESVIEQIVHEAEDGALSGTSEAAFLESVSSIMDRRLAEISQ